MPGAGPAFFTANSGTKRGRLYFGPTPKKRWRSRPISRVLSWTVIRLGATSPQRSSNLPGSSAGHANGSLFGLAPGGVCRAGPLPDSRCALTAPFHPYRLPEGNVGGIFLLHFPSACAAQALPGTLPYGARTFLGTLASDATVWPTPPGRTIRYCQIIPSPLLSSAYSTTRSKWCSNDQDARSAGTPTCAREDAMGQ